MTNTASSKLELTMIQVYLDRSDDKHSQLELTMIQVYHCRTIFSTRSDDTSHCQLVWPSLHGSMAPAMGHDALMVHDSARPVCFPREVMIRLGRLCPRPDTSTQVGAPSRCLSIPFFFFSVLSSRLLKIIRIIIIRSMAWLT